MKLDKAFPSMPESFEDAMRKGIRKGKQKMKLRNKIKVASIVAALAVCVLVVAFAAGNGGAPDNTVAASPTPNVAVTTVYTTDHGTVYHSDPNCQGMKNAVTMSELDAIEQGKQRCPICMSDEAVYATQHGVYYHAVPNCSGMQNASAMSESEAKSMTYEVGDIVTFGSYEQDNNTANGKEPIKWIILDKRDDGSLVLLSKYALDSKPYNTEDTGVTWETCTLRKRLNEDFYKAAFSAQEQAKIVPVTLENEDNPNYRTTGGKATTDKVWLLSINEACNDFSNDKVYSYFTDDASRMCAPTKYAVAQGAYQNSSYTVDGVGACWWWFRSPGGASEGAASVDYGGRVDDGGSHVSYASLGVRPVVVVLP